MQLPPWRVGLLLCFAMLAAIAASAQYPLSVSFPIGGDAADYADSARTLTSAASRPREAVLLLRQSWYPASLIAFSTSRLLPISWPERFTWFMAAAHVAVGLALAALAARYGGLPAAAAALFFWSLTTTGVTRFFEDATLAQLLSVGFAALFLERIAAGSTFFSLLALAATVAAHPITAIALLLATLTAAPALLLVRRDLPPALRRQVISIAAAALLIAAALFFTGKSPLDAQVGTSHETPLDISEYAAPVLALAPLGLLLIARASAVPLAARLCFLAFTAVCLLLAGNIYLGIGAWTDRLRSLAAAAVVVAAAVAAPQVIGAAFRSAAARSVFVVAALLPLLTLSWHASAKVYRYYENPDNFARLHPQEREAFAWITEHVPPAAPLYSVANNRHIEWLPPLANRSVTLLSSWTPFESNQELLPEGYLVVLTNWDAPPESVTGNRRLQERFSNQAAVIYESIP